MVPKFPISLNMSRSDWSEDALPRSALTHLFMLEFHPSLAIAAHVPTALKHSYWVTCNTLMS